ncbi:hypothetical protein AAFN88_16810 [Pelagibius sp. CAU 1746]|uniref:hypothetical protein n=1 Tax=Pelagibius sp. CAU 1746 TaxID=3140370 RepID=UPI00325B23DC
MRIFIVLGLASFLASCDSSICSNTMIHEIASPDGEIIAAVFERDCGATTPFVRIVNLRRSEAEFDPNMDDAWVFTIHGRSDVKAWWLGDRSLKVTYSATGDQPTMREKWNDVSVSYD